MRAFLVFLVLAVACIAAVGFYQGWFHLSPSPDEIAAATQSATDAVEGTSGRIKDRFGGSAKDGTEGTTNPSSAELSLTGVVTSVEPDAKRFAMRTTANKDLTIYTDAASLLRHNAADLAWGRLRPRDAISVDYVVRDGKNMAIRVTVTERFAAAR